MNWYNKHYNHPLLKIAKSFKRHGGKSLYEATISVFPKMTDAEATCFIVRHGDKIRNLSSRL